MTWTSNKYQNKWSELEDFYYQSNNKKMDKFQFLTSTRFWALVIGAVAFYLKAKGWVGDAEMILANTILAGFIAIKTVDRFGEQKVVAAGVTKGSVSVDTLSSIPPQE